MDKTLFRIIDLSLEAKLQGENVLSITLSCKINLLNYDGQYSIDIFHHIQAFNMSQAIKQYHSTQSMDQNINVKFQICHKGERKSTGKCEFVELMNVRKKLKENKHIETKMLSH